MKEDKDKKKNPYTIIAEMRSNQEFIVKRKYLASYFGGRTAIAENINLLNQLEKYVAEVEGERLKWREIIDMAVPDQVM
jgi:hypothetical protein